MPNNSSEEIKIINPVKRFVILDTNILSRLDSEVFGEVINNYLENLIEVSNNATEDVEWGLAVSEISMFEILNEIPYEKEEYSFSLLSKFPSFPVVRNVCVGAGEFGTMYKRYWSELGIQDKFPEMADKIIAATAYTEESVICTLNVRDYPAPFFKILITEHFTSANKCLFLYIVEPDLEVISDYHSKRVSRSQKKKDGKSNIKIEVPVLVN